MTAPAPQEKSRHDDLAAAIERGDAAAVEMLVRRHPDLVNCRDWTPPPLHCAVLWNQPEVAEVLLDRGADIEMRDRDRDTTPLRYAILHARRRMIPLLLSRGANPGAIKENGTTAIELAIEGAGGAFEKYDDLPSRAEYGEVVDVLKQLGLE